MVNKKVLVLTGATVITAASAVVAATKVIKEKKAKKMNTSECISEYPEEEVAAGNETVEQE